MWVNLWDIFNLLNYFNTVSSALYCFGELRTTVYAGVVNAWCSWGPESWFTGWVSNKCTEYVDDVWFQQGVKNVKKAWADTVLTAHTELVQRKHNTVVMFSFRLYFYARELMYCCLCAYFWYVFLVGVMPAVLHQLQRWLKSVEDEVFRVRVKRKDRHGHLTATDVSAMCQSDTTSQGQELTRVPAGEVLHALNVAEQFHTCVVCQEAHADRECPGCDRQICCRICVRGLISDEEMKKKCPSCRVSSDEAEMADSGPFMCIEISSANVNRFAHPLFFPFRCILCVNEKAFKAVPKALQVLMRGFMVLYGAYIIGYYHYYESEYKPAVFRCSIAHEALYTFLYDYVC